MAYARVDDRAPISRAIGSARREIEPSSQLKRLQLDRPGRDRIEELPR